MSQYGEAAIDAVGLIATGGREECNRCLDYRGRPPLPGECRFAGKELPSLRVPRTLRRRPRQGHSQWALHPV